jgi:transposase, IS30 family
MREKPRFTYLSDSERSEIEILHNRGYSIRGIARVLGRSPNTVSLEIKRVPSGYRAKLAKQYVRANLKNRRYQKKKIDRNRDLQKYIIYGLQSDWNPDEISGRIKESGKSFCISKSTIYTWLETVMGERYKKYLYHKRPGRRHKKSGLQGKLPNLTCITDRPESISRRQRAGDWESDLVVSRRGTPTAISTSRERVSRYFVANKVQDQGSKEKQKTLELLTKEFLVRSITFDCGHENARHRELGIPTYFCNPYSSWEKGSIENGNKCLRRYLPKKADLSLLSEERLQEYVARINNKPRKILGYRTALEVATELGIIRSIKSKNY